jgi:hypothetical protein
VRSGQLEAPPGFNHWLLKFDGVRGNKDKELNDPKGYGLIELAYSRMARAAGITMSDCRLLEENGRQHFMTRRFDREDTGQKLHMQSLGALAHCDYNEPGSYSYEQAFLVVRQLQLPMRDLEEQYRRMVFNLVARNQDDHVKNIAFLMDRTGQWSLSPGFDITWSFNPTGDWTANHQILPQGWRYVLGALRQLIPAAEMRLFGSPARGEAGPGRLGHHRGGSDRCRQHGGYQLSRRPHLPASLRRSPQRQRAGGAGHGLRIRGGGRGALAVARSLEPFAMTWIHWAIKHSMGRGVQWPHPPLSGGASCAAPLMAHPPPIRTSTAATGWRVPIRACSSASVRNQQHDEYTLADLRSMVIDALPGRVFMSGNSQAACIPVEFRLSREAQLA